MTEINFSCDFEQDRYCFFCVSITEINLASFGFLLRPSAFFSVLSACAHGVNNNGRHQFYRILFLEVRFCAAFWRVPCTFVSQCFRQRILESVTSFSLLILRADGNLRSLQVTSSFAASNVRYEGVAAFILSVQSPSCFAVARVWTAGDVSNTRNVVCLLARRLGASATAVDLHFPVLLRLF